MDHAGNLMFGFCLDRDTVPAVSRRNYGVLQISAAVCLIHDLIDLSAYAFVHAADGTADGF